MTNISKSSVLFTALVASATLTLAAAGSALAGPTSGTTARGTTARGTTARGTTARGTTPRASDVGSVTRPRSVLPPPVAPFTLASGTVNVGGLDTNTSFCYNPSPAPTSIMDDPVHPTCTPPPAAPAAVNPFDVPVPFPGWAAPLAGSGWVGPQANARDNQETVPGWYIYDAEFKGCAQLKGKVRADNEVGVFLNGNLLANSTGDRNFQGTPLSFAGTATSPGLNIVDFVVYDSSSPATGADYHFTGMRTKNCRTWTVKRGHTFKMTASKVTLADSATGTSVTCATSNGFGTLQAGAGLPGTGIGSIAGLAFNTCTGPLNLAFTVLPGNLPYPLNAISYAVPVTTGTVTGIHLTLTAAGCSAVVAGQLQVTHSNLTHRLDVVGGNLHIWNIIGCAGVANGDPVTFTASYVLTPPQTITSP